jgi:SP family general alpha glucoside:H+ symporter-like MFS transporter
MDTDDHLSNIVGIACSVLTPYMVNPTAWNWSKKTAFFWA